MAEGHEGTADPRLEAEGELSMARLALEGGDLRHAAGHVARALAFDPRLPEVHELLARLAVHPDGGPGLYPVDQPAYLGDVVARAHTFAVLDHPDQALPLLVTAQCHRPDGAWADAAWMYERRTAERLEPELVRNSLLRLAGALGDPVGEQVLSALRPYLALVDLCLEARPEEPQLLWAASMLLRRCGRAGDAVALALRAEAVEPSFHAAMAAGYAFRAEKRWEEAERAWLRALQFDPGNLALHTDIGELLATAGRPRDGLAWVERALEQDPQDPTAFPTACGMRFSLDGRLEHLVALADHLRERPGGDHPDRVLTQSSQSRHWLGPIPPPTEAVVDVLHRLQEQGGAPEGSRLALTVSAPEPPSALLALRLAAPGCTVEVGAVPEPDPRLTVPEVADRGPVRAVERRLWRYRGTTAEPAVGPPSDQAQEALRTLASYPWRHLPAAYDDAVRLSALPLEDLLGVMAHPPAPPNVAAGVWPAWIRRVQAWACLGIAHHRADQPWEGSERRSALIDLAFGPEDWAAEAALLSMAATAWVRPEARKDVAGLVAWRFLLAMEAARTRAVTVLDSFAHLVRAVPDMDPEVLRLAEEALRDDSDGPDATGEDGDAGDTRGTAQEREH
ncbi:tetratricopeptide repeat protein [Nocardiopsis baichengensis]|uniref:tetratricopeptide repeat protein n=1 Tax=Nocardiopsis baichengensis TaxID=280240 RepID=UPI0003489E93|nr:tetratricopeptide repeat protein [Nocardiopsis baichengensis]